MTSEIKFLSGTTAQCDAHTGQEGTWVIDIEEWKLDFMTV